MKIIFHPEQKVTQWFISEQPVNVGVYERSIDDLGMYSQPIYAYWDGDVWYQVARSPERAEHSFLRGYHSTYQWTMTTQRWRGLTR